MRYITARSRSIDAQARLSRLMRAECPACGCIIRITRKWADASMPRCTCPTHALFVLTDAPKGKRK